MAVKRNLTVDDAKLIQSQTGHEIIIAVAISPADGTLEYASYGSTKKYCADAKVIADDLFRHISGKLGGLQ